MEGIVLVFILVVVLVSLVGLIATNVKIVSQTNVYVIERLGSYRTTWGNGLHFKMPFIERMASKISTKEQVVDFPPQPVITKDNVTMQIDTVVYFQVTDPMMFTYGVNNPLAAIENLTATTLRNIIGDLELDESLTSRDIINTKMRAVLDEATDPWGIKINRVELKNILPPQEIRVAMEKQMRAERERREAIALAEGQKQSQILRAEGNRQSTLLEADATKQARILQAEGEAQAILSINEATAKGLEMIKSVQADQSLISLKSLDTLEKVADGQATKLIIPSNLQNLGSLAASLKEVISE